MDFETYKTSLAEEAPPEGLSMAAQALWWEAKGDWHLAHQCARKQRDAEGAGAHPYLHRVEGDLRNAGGWYNRAGRPASTAPLKEEWEKIARALHGWTHYAWTSFPKRRWLPLLFPRRIISHRYPVRRRNPGALSA